jgi:hypothetical protein
MNHKIYISQLITLEFDIKVEICSIFQVNKSIIAF